MSELRARRLRSGVALPLSLGLLVLGGACSSRQNDIAFGQGGDASTGGNHSPAGSAATAGSSASSGGAGQAGGPAGAPGAAGAAVEGGMDAGGTSVGGAAGLAGAGESGAPLGGSGGAGSGGRGGGGAGGGGAGAGGGAGGCDEGCIQLCEGGLCMCSCPTTTLKCPNTVQNLELSFSSACKVDADCFAAEHFTGCCRVSVVGLSAVQRESFNAWEADTCKSPPVCGCAVDVLTTDDGNMIRREMTYSTHCTAGKCVTSSP